MPYRCERSLHRLRIKDSFPAHSFGGLPVCRRPFSNCWTSWSGHLMWVQNCSSLKCISSQEGECLAHLREVFTAFASQICSLQIALSACLSAVLCFLIADIMIRTPDESSDNGAHRSALPVRKGNAMQMWEKSPLLSLYRLHRLIHCIQLWRLACLPSSRREQICSLIADIMIRASDEASDIAAHWSALPVRKGNAMQMWEKSSLLSLHRLHRLIHCIQLWRLACLPSSAL